VAVTLTAAVAGVAVGTVAAPGAHAAAATSDAKKWRFDASAATLVDVAKVIGADVLTGQGHRGTGVGVALIDTGIAPVPGLTAGNVVNGPDLSFDSQDPATRYRDGYGHGTHLAGIIAGRDTTGTTGGTAGSGGVTGIAPGATLTSVKVGAANGAVDVSQVIAAIDWVVAHRNDDRTRPIRVLALAYGTDGVQDYKTDPLTHAVENAWRAGIVVVVAAGNTGTTTPRLANPAYDPYVLTVGAADTKGTGDPKDDTVTDFSSRGDATRRVDLVAPGRSIVALRAPGSDIDTAYPGAQVGTRFFKGSGTSQAAAVTAGAAALLLGQRPTLTPDQVKTLLVDTAGKLPAADAAGAGAGELNVLAASKKATPTSTQTWTRSTGRGLLEAARGTIHVDDNGIPLTGEKDIFGSFTTTTWSTASTNRTSWTGGTWMGNPWTGTNWLDTLWITPIWSGRSWSGRSWSGRSWSGLSWSGRSWSGRSWSGSAWS
jgi:serine protease AprX